MLRERFLLLIDLRHLLRASEPSARLFYAMVVLCIVRLAIEDQGVVPHVLSLFCMAGKDFRSTLSISRHAYLLNHWNARTLTVW